MTMLLRAALPALSLAVAVRAAPAGHLVARDTGNLPFSTGALVGIIVGGVALVVIVIVVIVVMVKRRRRRSRAPSWSQERFAVSKAKSTDGSSTVHDNDDASHNEPLIPPMPDIAHPTPLRPGSFSFSRPSSTLSSHPLLRFDPPTPRSSHYDAAPSPTAAQHIASVSADTLPNPHSLQPSTQSDDAEVSSIATLPNPHSHDPSTVSQDDRDAPPASPTSTASVYSMFSDQAGALSRSGTRASRRVPSFKSYQRITPTQELHEDDDDEHEDHETPLLSSDRMEMPVPMVDGYMDEDLR
ncbi:hypothetical protein OBBRIDRAFT_790585 [Obba rivulosa]|uniref:Uncharacterized protein n=1 Tax=Obba rivulosa TaxID=1052685 RepID=A0A8E2AZC3_9APHY|nr:hypothetical protein OBBRIDRAFT_790585 [Obba rivulosa]